MRRQSTCPEMLFLQLMSASAGAPLDLGEPRAASAQQSGLSYGPPC